MLNLLPREDALRPRRGWYAYRVTGAASLPSWAVEIALAVERPVDLHPEGSPSHNDGVPGDPPSSRIRRSARRGAGRPTAFSRTGSTGSGDRAAQSTWQAELAGGDRRGGRGGRGGRRCPTRHRCGPVVGEPVGGAVTPAHRSVATWTGPDSSCRRAGTSRSGRVAGSRRSPAAPATGGGRSAGVVGGGRGHCPDL